MVHTFEVEETYVSTEAYLKGVLIHEPESSSNDL